METKTVRVQTFSKRPILSKLNCEDKIWKDTNLPVFQCKSKPLGDMNSVSRHTSGKDVCVTLKVPRSTVALSIPKSGTTRTFASLGSLALTQRSGEKVLSKRRDQEPNVDEFQRSCVQMGERSRRSTINAALH